MKKYVMMICTALMIVSCEKDPDLDEMDTRLVVYTDHDSETDFGNFKTYYLPDSILEAGGYKASYWSDENAKKIISTVENEMKERGYVRITDPERKGEADAGLQLSYVAQSINIVGGGYYGGWWDYGFWGPWWGGWYYPYPIAYSFNTNSLIMEMVDLTNKTEKAQLPVVWYAQSSGYQYSGPYNRQLLMDAVHQAFEQSDYIKAEN